jgi:ubiquinone/menaquinone biosynthesis C-methylase UbiE
MAAGILATAFDRAAEGYDRDFGTNAAGLLFRQVVQRRMLELAPAGSLVLDVGCGTGEDALFLAEQGRRVHAIDVSQRMLRRCREKAEGRGIGPERLATEQRAAEHLAALGAQRFDAAFSDFGVLNCADLAAVGQGLAQVLRPGARVLVSVMPARPLPATAARVLAGRGEPRGRRMPRVGGMPVPVHHPTPRRVREAFGAGFAWDRCYALGVLLPGPDHGAWAARHPLAFGAVAAAEALVRAWPLLRSHGDHVVMEGARR